MSNCPKVGTVQQCFLLSFWVLNIQGRGWQGLSIALRGTVPRGEPFSCSHPTSPQKDSSQPESKQWPWICLMSFVEWVNPVFVGCLFFCLFFLCSLLRTWQHLFLCMLADLAFSSFISGWESVQSSPWSMGVSTSLDVYQAVVVSTAAVLYLVADHCSKLWGNSVVADQCQFMYGRPQVIQETFWGFSGSVVIGISTNILNVRLLV